MPHIHELYDFTTSAFIVHQNKILLVHHKKLDKWMQPGGHIELNEDPLEALWREIEEETGLSSSELSIIELSNEKIPAGRGVKTLPIPFHINVHQAQPGSPHQHIDYEYLVRASSDTVRLEGAGAHAIDWFTKEELAEKLEAGEIFEGIYERCLFALKYLSSLQ